MLARFLFLLLAIGLIAAAARAKRRATLDERRQRALDVANGDGR